MEKSKLQRRHDKKTFNPNPIKKQRRINSDSVADDQKLHYANSLDEANYGGLSINDIKTILKCQTYFQQHNQ